MSEGMHISTSAISSSEVKSPTAFRTISEVADGLALPQHVLRFWESKFPQIKPLKRGGGRRYYRPEDVKVIHDIKDLLHNQGFTIRGVQKLLRESGATSIARSMVAQPRLPDGMQSLSLETASTVSISTPTQQVKPVSSSGISGIERREVEGILAELKSLRKLLQQSGI
jgi:DNA-binding transcriptional MerR regulator